MTDDLISRDAAIEAVLELKAEHRVSWKDAVIDMIDALPSVRPDPLTDKEQRIFLAAMGREENICRKVDDECRDTSEPNGESLVRVCRAIERKVKKAIWTN